MNIKGATPPVTRRAASFVTPGKPPEVKEARTVWTPSKHGWVIGKCGHVCADDLEIVAIGAIIKAFKGVKVWCETCHCFVPAVAKASTLKLVGIVPLPIPPGDAPPPF